MPGAAASPGARTSRRKPSSRARRGCVRTRWRSRRRSPRRRTATSTRPRTPRPVHGAADGHARAPRGTRPAPRRRRPAL